MNSHSQWLSSSARMQMCIPLGAACQLSEGQFPENLDGPIVPWLLPGSILGLGYLPPSPYLRTSALPVLIFQPEKPAKSYPFWELKVPPGLICQGQVPLDFQATQVWAPSWCWWAVPKWGWRGPQRVVTGLRTAAGLAKEGPWRQVSHMFFKRDVINHFRKRQYCWPTCSS